MGIKEELVSIVGLEYYKDAPEILESYSKDYSFVKPCNPGWVVFPKQTEEIQAILRFANQKSIGVTPRSSKVSFYGAGIPSQGGIVLDLTRMNRIIEVDTKDRNVKVEPGVTWEQVQSELEKHDMMVCNPLLPHRLKSVLTSCMQREPMLIPKGEHSEPFRTGEIVLASGDLFYLGTAIAKGCATRSSPDCFIPSTRLFMSSQGTLGVLTWANLSTVYLPAKDRLYFAAFDSIEKIAEPLYRIQRKMLGNECFILDNLNLAMILAEGDDDILSMSQELPPYTMILCLSGRRFPEEKIEYEYEALKEISLDLNFEIARNVLGDPDTAKRMLRMLRKPWANEGYWKLRFKGSSHSIFFITTLNRVKEFADCVNNIAVKYGYPTGEIDFYLQPMERARACYCQFGLHCDPQSAREVTMVRNFFNEASEKLVDMGGLFSNPYDRWSDLVYDRSTTFVSTLRMAKDVLDPNHILNPGKLCF
jgi:FAD/FMN-containing dehydrogenase